MLIPGSFVVRSINYQMIDRAGMAPLVALCTAGFYDECGMAALIGI
ncbi:hypothetical protein LSP04_20730 [Levilactobacillus spicheri]|uniref:Uncharacterized protein n=1 Tax=Levilactobacillus spicheri TaxID=216463 RepID=A0ABQ0WRV0_9LACO|nr:hypothetical protein LSP04_20730 [Levilactobacillus spicheri]